MDGDLLELASLLGGTFRGLKSVGPPPQPLLEALEAAELGERHKPVLLDIALAGPMSVSELARRRGLGLPTTSTIVGQLSRAGLIERSEDEQDRRRTIVRLHENHREGMDAWLAIALAPLRDTLEELSPQARAGFMEGWRILHRHAGGIGESAAADCGDESA